MSDDGIFGCGKHGGKLFGAHTDEEKTEDGYVQVKAGQWKKASSLGLSNEQVALIRAFDSGVLPDAHSQEHADEWRKIGGEYMDGVGPVVRNNDQLRDWGKVSGIWPKGSHVVEKVKRRPFLGKERKSTKKVRTFRGFDAVYGNIIRQRDDILANISDHNRDMKMADEVRRELEKHSHRPKKYHFINR